jgi:hypothetical protein
LLLATNAVYGLVGSVADGNCLLISVLSVGAISIYRQQRTERVLESLKICRVHAPASCAVAACFASRANIWCAAN